MRNLYSLRRILHQFHGAMVGNQFVKKMSVDFVFEVTLYSSVGQDGLFTVANLIAKPILRIFPAIDVD